MYPVQSSEHSSGYAALIAYSKQSGSVPRCLITSPSSNCLALSVRCVAMRACSWLLSLSIKVRCVNFTFWCDFAEGCCHVAVTRLPIQHEEDRRRCQFICALAGGKSGDAADGGGDQRCVPPCSCIAFAVVALEHRESGEVVCNVAAKLSSSQRLAFVATVRRRCWNSTWSSCCFFPFVLAALLSCLDFLRTLPSRVALPSPDCNCNKYVCNELGIDKWGDQSN